MVISYFNLLTVTEDEIQNGIFNDIAPNSHCLCYIREISNLQDNIPEAITSRYIDSDPEKPTQVDSSAQFLLQQLKEEKIPSVLAQSNIKKIDVPWTKGGVTPDRHKQYLEWLCNEIYTDVKRLIDGALATRESKIPELHQDILHHASFCISKCESFCGREEIIAQIRQFVASGKQKPLVIYGSSGSGKTSIMAKSAVLARDWMAGTECTVVLRFLGISPASSSIREVLVSVCTQVGKVYSLTVPNFSEMDSTQIKQYFCGHFLDSLQMACHRDKHLCIFLDSIDQLSPLDGAHSLNWLPKSLPQSINIVVSMLPDKHDCLKTIRSLLPFEECYIEVGVLPVHSGLEIMDTWLAKINRTMNMEQRNVLSKIFSLNPQPLYLRLLFHNTQQWFSYTTVHEASMAISTPKAILRLFSNLEEQYGKVLVQKALGYITAARNGLTELELEDALSLDNDVLNEVYQYWDPPDESLVRIPALLWKRIRHEISDYLVEQHADEKTVLAWYHRQFIENARSIYLGDEKKKFSIHQILSEYFEGVWSGDECKPITLVHRNLNLDTASRQVALQPIMFSEKAFNLRKLNELPYHLLFSRQMEKMKSIVLCNFRWLYTKLKITGFQNMMYDFKLSLAETEDTDISTTSEALSLSANNLMSDADSLSGQLLGRLKCLSDTSPRIQTLTEQAHRWAVASSGKHHLVPYNNCLISPGGPLKTTLSGHPQVLYKISMSKTHSLMVSSSKGSNCSIFNVWNVQSLPQYVQNLHTLKLNDVGIPNFCLVDELLLGASGHSVACWNCITGEKIFSFDISHKVTSIAATWSTSLMLLGLEDGTILTYDRLSGTTFESRQHNSSICCIAVSEDDTVTITASQCGQLGIYSTMLHSHCDIKIIQAHSSAIMCVKVMSHSGKLFVISGSEDKTAKVWCISRGDIHPLHTLTGHTKTIKCIDHAVVDSRSCVAITGSLDKTIRIWDAILSGQCLRTLKGHLDGVWCIATITNGPKLVSGSKDDYLKVWDMNTGECLHTLEGHSSWVSCVTTSGNDIIISGSNDKNIKVWRLESSRSPPTDRHFAQPECIVTTKNGLIISGAPDAIKVWDATTAKCLHTLSSPASSICTTDDNKYLISGAKDSTITVWDLTSFTKLRTIDSQSPVTCLEAIDLNRYLCADGAGSLTIRDLHTADKVTTLTGHSSAIKCMLLSKDKSMAASGSHDCTICVWDISKTICAAVLKGHTKVVWCIAISSDNTHIASGGDDSTVRIWNISESHCLHQISCPDNVKCVAFSLDDSVVIAGCHCGQNQLKAWNTSTGDCVMNYIGHTHAVMCVQVVDSRTIVTGSRDGTVKVWDIVNVRAEMLASFDLQSQVKYIALLESVQKGTMSLAATTKTGPIAILKCYRPNNY